MIYLKIALNIDVSIIQPVSTYLKKRNAVFTLCEKLPNICSLVIIHFTKLLESINSPKYYIIFTFYVKNTLIIIIH